MTERTRGSQTSGSPQEAIDLNELHASKTQETLRASALDAANTDLASASIQSISVVRLSTRPEKRNLSNRSSAPNAETSQLREPKKLKRLTPRSKQRHGIFKHPYFPYEGDPLTRRITLLANILKVLELSILNAFKPAPPQTPPKTLVRKEKKRDENGREIEEDGISGELQTAQTFEPHQD